MNDAPWEAHRCDCYHPWTSNCAAAGSPRPLLIIEAHRHGAHQPRAITSAVPGSPHPVRCPAMCGRYMNELSFTHEREKTHLLTNAVSRWSCWTKGVTSAAEMSHWPACMWQQKIRSRELGCNRNITQTSRHPERASHNGPGTRVRVSHKRSRPQ